MSLTIYGVKSWKHFKKQLHSKSKSASTSLQSGWGDFWRLSKPNSQMQQEKISNLSEPQANLPIDPRIYQPIVNISREEKYKMLWSSQFQAENVLSVWQQSWVTIKKKKPFRQQGTTNAESEGR